MNCPDCGTPMTWKTGLGWYCPKCKLVRKNLVKIVVSILLIAMVVVVQWYSQ